MRSLIWSTVAVLCGWTIFLYWWSVVLEKTTRAAFFYVVAGIMFSLAVLFIVSLFWIIHNLRLAGRGRRSSSTPYFPGPRSHDQFDRSLLIKDLETLRTSSVVVIHADERGKSYVRDDAGRVA